MLVTALAAAGTVGCFLRASRLQSEGEWLMARANAQAEQYATTFDGSYADQQLATFDEHREVMLSGAHLWKRLQMLGVMLTVLSAFSTYVLFVLAKLRTEIEEITEGEVRTQP
jgi:hypothetical protein